MMSDLGYTEGDACNRDGCIGVIDTHPPDGCFCHIDPPCAACSGPRNFCPECDWQEKDDPLVVMEVTRVYLPSGCTERTKRVLDPTKIDYRIESHTNSSQLCVGVYPPGTNSKEVEAVVKGTFGGRFNIFKNGRFEYIAYTD
jgi:hypothetical protein